MTFIACAHGRTEDFPNLEGSLANAKVYVIRDNNLLGWGFSLKVALDDVIIARLRSGEYVSFNVRPGFHSLGVSKSTLTVPFEKGNKYYFLIIRACVFSTKINNICANKPGPDHNMLWPERGWMTPVPTD